MNAKNEPVLVVDDDPDIREILKDRLAPLGHPVITAENGKQALDLISREVPAVMFIDLQMPVMDGMAVLKKLKEHPELAVIVITAHGTIEKAVEAMREGAFDFVTKPFCMNAVDAVIRRAFDRAALVSENRNLKAQLAGSLPDIIGESTKLREAIEVAQKVAATASTVLLLGESGCGKEVFARWIHHWSPRAQGPFIAVNCVALRDELLESELFGHEKGAFTGAHEMRQGKFEIANGGTIFLDEIGDFKPELQAKLLRVLQEREFERVGGNKRIHVDIRVIAATNRDLHQEVRDGHFREDLFFRLNVVSISLPPLRERKEDIPLLSEFFLKRYCSRFNKCRMKISTAAMDHLMRYNWPGNIRELANLIERAVILANGPNITPEDLPLLRINHPDHDDLHGLSYHDAVRRYQKQVIREALQSSGGNQSKAADQLGLQRTYLSRLIKKLEIADDPDT
jgi:two-component system, NtrC family, response regulator AtoC